MDDSNIPRHVAIIMDGNGRWASKRGLPRELGHREGAEALRRIVREAADLGISHLTVYAFSTENWSRPAEEVGALNRLIGEYVAAYLDTFVKNGIRVRVIGDIERMDPKTRGAVEDLVAKTAGNAGLNFTIAWNYGGRAEIAKAAREIAREAARGELDPESVDEATFGAHLYTAGLPDPDLIIRTSGEFRTSNFLPWQGAYAEYWVTPTLWPDFGKKELAEAVAAYGKRKRRFGGR